MSKAKKVKAAILKMIDLKIKTYQFEGKMVTKEDLFEMLEKEEQTQDFVTLIDYKDDSRSLEIEEIDSRTVQLCFECDPQDWTKSVNSWIFKISLC